MAINPFLLLSGMGMMAVAVIAVVWWRMKTSAGWKFFIAGAGVWVIAVAVKTAMDLTITGPIQDWLYLSGGIWTVILGIGIYAGLRTGFFESGFSYIVVIRTKLKKMNFREAVAFGIGFGAIEAFVLGITSVLSVLIFVLMPEIITTMSGDLQAIILDQLGASTLIVIPPIIERIAAIMLHTFAAVLVVYAVHSGKLKYLAYSIIYKACIDGIIPFLVFTIEPGASVANAFLIEIPVVIFGLVGYSGIKWLKKKKW